MDRNQPGFHRLFGIGANTANMPGIAQCGDANAIFHRALDAKSHGLGRHSLAKTPFAINHGKGAAICHHIGGLALQHIARFQPFHVTRHAYYAMAVMPGQIRIHQMAADAAGFRAITAGSLKHIGDQRIKRLGIDHNGRGAAHEGVLRKKGKARRPSISRRGAITWRRSFSPVAPAGAYRSASPAFR